MSLSAGDRIGPYEILAPLGAGGMGEVYRGRDTKLKRDVALKVLPEAFARDPERMARFQREAEVLASLNHPNIAHIYGVEERALVMELIEGAEPKGPMPFDDAWKIASQIADALEYAHEKGVIHRDLKPANVKVTPEGVVKLLDFGLAKAFINSPDPSSDPANSPTLTVGATVAGTIIGTAAYMAPEQARGKRVDKRADIYSWGVLLYELLTGERLCQGEDVADTLVQVLTKQPDLERVPPQVRRLLGECLQKDPKLRLRDIGDARRLLTDERASDLETRSKEPARGSTLAWIAAAVLALIAGVALWAPWRGNRSAATPLMRFTMEIAPAEMLGPTQFFSRPSYPAIAISPDGATVVFSGTRGSANTRQTQLYKRALDQSEAAPVPGTEGGAEPFFSPDGQWVGFSAGGKLKKIPLNGGPAATICEVSNGRVAWGANWSSNNNIVFALGSSGVMQVPAAGGSPQVLLKPDPTKEREYYSSPQLLSDGKTLLFTERTSENWDDARIMARRLDTGEQRELIKGGADGRYVPTGHLVYMQNAVLMAVPFDARRVQLAGAPVAMLDGVMQGVNMPNGFFETGMGQFAISTSGHLIYAAGGIAPPLSSTLVRVDRKGAEMPLNAPKARYTTVRASPDGQRLAVVKGSNVNRTSDIWVIDIATGNSTRLTSDGTGGSAVWWPDGKRILFSGGDGQLLSVAADGSSAANPEMKTAARPASFSQDGKRLASLEFRDGLFQLWIRPMSAPGEPKRFAESKFSIYDPHFSPDGRWIVYYTGESGTEEVYVQASEGPGEKHRISTHGGFNPAWARGGRELFYFEGRGTGKVALMAVDFAAEGAFKAGAPHALFEGMWDTTIPVRNYDVTPDGHFIFSRSESPPGQPVTKLNVVLNWFDELKKRAPSGAR